MTSVIPNSSLANPTPCLSHVSQGPPSQMSSTIYHNQHRAPYSDDDLHSVQDNSQQHLSNPTQQYRRLQPINQEYDLNYPHSHGHHIPYGRTGRDPSLKAKSAKRVSKSLPPDPLMGQRHKDGNISSIVRFLKRWR
ncbi:hypothetical protein BX616_009544 [Lobosporangium transversale]|uniref:Uncharacterized protein n=1 Tax=Lobosporangium transversale TaxID=64571 RepID=A0A1Y2GC61_9FUNG|nr:hypothetical protein BCR41DRAFT_185546 [Lobosporangium transversale]KAF9913806.1 hypothetical protein BX616_009544 [Lobosporangium transversale]ORZ05516.1 hypothetical protein BCR41DRAFT_185546 [Lobosporangium transversale]|eukprot:XP_021877090.1 hypothetical protein BCR41DRAFT_185546 [Lobosporangium transversale]